jgi:DNA-binding winged helix-turn-helix (wHTH) protein/TolB-like protein
MPARPDVPSVIRFGPYEADLHSGELRKDGTTIRLQQKPFQLLTVLLENPGRLVTREELHRRLWDSDTFVDFDNSLNTAITKLREAFGDSAEEHRYVETLARRGYRFVAPVEEVGKPTTTRAAGLRLVQPSNEQVGSRVIGNLQQPGLASGPTDLESLQPDLEPGSDQRPTGPGLGQRRRQTAWIGGGLVLAVIAGLIGWYLAKPKIRNTTELSRRTTIAVLPFQNASKDASLDYLSTALPDEVITTLSYAPTLNIRPFSMSQQFTPEKSDPHQAGRQLRASQVVTGRFRRQGDRVGVTLEATDVANDEIVWHGSVDVTSKDVLMLRQELTTALQKGLLPALGVSNVELSRTKPKNQEAYESYLRSQDSASWSTTLNKDAITMLEKSVALDPGYAPAWLALGLHYSNDSDFGSGGEAMYNKTVAALQRAHQLDPDLLTASTMLIERRAFYEDLTASFAQIQELARRRPHTAGVHSVFSEVLRAAGAPEQAARQCEIVHQLDPEFPSGNCIVLYVHTGDYAKARQEIDRSPGDFSTMMLGQVLLREGKVEEALPKLKSIPAGMGYELIRDCWPDSSTAICATTARQSEASFRTITFSDAWYFGAALLAFVDKKDNAIRLLRAATEHSLCVYPSVDSDPLFDKIRNSAEFQAARQAGIQCQQKFASYAKVEVQ